MKSSFLLFLLTASQLCFGQKTAANAKMGEVVIKGKIGNVNPPASLWIKIGDDTASDSVAIKNGRFKYRKKTMLPAYGFIRVNYDRSKSKSPFSNMTLMNMFFEEGTITVTSPVDSLSTTGTKIKGSRLQERYVSYYKKERDLLKAQKALTVELSNASPEQLQSKTYLESYEKSLENSNKKLDELITSELKRFPRSYHSFMAYWGYLQSREPDEKLARSIASLVAEPHLKPILEMLDRWYKPKEPIAQLSKGDIAPDFVQTDVTGKSIRLSDFKGKYLLVDFWASWCKPCRKINPDLVKLYQKHKSVQFEILGVSLDEKKDEWERAIEEDRLQWVHVSELKGWKSEVVKQFNIEAIPQNYLLDKEGKILAKNLNIALLDSLLANLVHGSAHADTAVKTIVPKLVNVGDEVNLELPDQYGRLVNLSAYRGKYLLLDFWASWCKPCRIENPFMIKLYETFRSPRFEMISISIDTDRAAWFRAVKADGLLWLNLSDLQGDKGKASPFVGFNVKGERLALVPQNYLIDPSGKVIAKNIHGQELQTLLSKTLNTGI